MKIINTADSYVKNIIGNQEIEVDLEYVESPYLIKYENAFYNALTREAIIVDDIEKDIAYLIRHWFYIPKGFDVLSLCHLIRQKRLNIENGPGSKLKRSYTIFTTTACNASCSYCFEKGYNILTMSEKTAEDVATYILKSRTKSRTVNIEWFGGEPLCNKKVMTIICSILKENGVKYTSGITTNGSLLPECSDEELRDIWNVTHIQLTFDDVEDGYDNSKNLPRGTFDKLINSIERLEKLKIYIYGRVHYDPNKGKEACIRAIDTISRFSNVHPYVKLLYDIGKKEYYDDLLELNDYVGKYRNRIYTFPTVTKINHCMADTDKIVAITPEGKLSPCGHYPYGENIFGDIYSTHTNNDILKRWRVREKVTKKECINCPLYPSCKKLAMCPAEGKCSDGYQYYQIETLKRALRKKVSDTIGHLSNGNALNYT